MEHRKPGRPGKGARKQVKARLPERLAEAFQAEAARRGITITDWIGQFAAEQTGIPYDPQEALKLSA
jgi:predicted HicB family RNase H-like nuclease